MPIVNVTMVAGRSAARKQKLVRTMTDAIVDSLDAPRESVRIIINEVPAWHFAAGGELKGQAPNEG